MDALKENEWEAVTAKTPLHLPPIYNFQPGPAQPWLPLKQFPQGDDMRENIIEYKIDQLVTSFQEFRRETAENFKSVDKKIDQVDDKLSAKIDQVDDKLSVAINMVDDRVNKAAICVGRLDERTKTTNGFVIGIAVAVVAGICLQGIIWAISR